MFTGLIEERGRVEAVDASAGGVRLRVAASIAGEVAEGDSIAVDGVCLTAVDVGTGSVSFDVMNESLRRSALAGLEPGSEVNIERAVRADGRLGGHIVSGHVDEVGFTAGVSDDGFAQVLTVTAGPDLLRLVVEKGSICLQGVSLTVSAVTGESFSVSLIPETLSRTTLGSLCSQGPGRPVNLEADIVAKHVEKLLAARLSEIGSSAMYEDRDRT